MLVGDGVRPRETKNMDVILAECFRRTRTGNIRDGPHQP